VIVLHGRDATPDDIQIVDMLRRRLPERGWASLSLTLPEPQDNQPLAQAVARTQAGVEHLKGKKARSVVLIGHDSGARALVGYLLNQPDPAIRAVVVVDPQRVPGPENGGTAMEQVEQLRLPLLDLRTGRDSSSAADDARSWRAAFRNNPGYRQLILNDPHPLWDDLEDFVVNRIHGWLARQQGPAQAPASAAKPKPPGAAGGPL
jgi:pimeloyl-ACP methyl ester carboxylesterase